MPLCVKHVAGIKRCSVDVSICFLDTWEEGMWVMLHPRSDSVITYFGHAEVDVRERESGKESDRVWKIMRESSGC